MIDSVSVQKNNNLKAISILREFKNDLSHLYSITLVNIITSFKL
jgi:hypothetical protein